MDTAINKLPAQVLDDVQYQHHMVSTFAKAQLDSLHSFETEISPGVIAGQQVIPMTTAGCSSPEAASATSRAPS